MHIFIKWVLQIGLYCLLLSVSLGLVGCDQTTEVDSGACAPGILDACNVCEGDGTSCADCSDPSFHDPCSDLSIASLTYDENTHDLWIEMTNGGAAMAMNIELARRQPICLDLPRLA